MTDLAMPSSVDEGGIFGQQSIHALAESFDATTQDPVSEQMLLIASGAPRSGTTTASPLACTKCKTTYSRPEHLRRHMVRHQGEKPYECSHCKKRYSRRDVWKRHFQTCQLAAGVSDSANGIVLESTCGRSRRNHACQRCSRMKLRCSSKQPCSSCTNASVECVAVRREGKQGSSKKVKIDLSQKSRPANTLDYEPDNLSSFDGAEATTTVSTNLEVSYPLASTEQIIPSFSFPTSRLGGSSPVAARQLALQSETPISNPQATVSFSGMEAFLEPSMSKGFPQSTHPPSESFPLLDFPNPHQISPHPFGLGFAEDFTEFNRLIATLSPIDSFDTSLPTLDSQQSMLLETMTDSTQLECHGGQCSLSERLPEGLNLIQVDPFEGHRSTIADELYLWNEDNHDALAWLSCANMKVFLLAYFRCFHRHTPIIHVPKWNIGSTRSHLLLAMMLVGSMYSGDVKINGPKVRSLYSLAEHYVWKVTESEDSDGEMALDTLQSLYLLALLDSFYVPSRKFQPTFDFKRLVSLAREGGYFREEAGASVWEKWGEQESQRRTVFALYLLDSARSIFFCEKPQMIAVELQRILPTHDEVFAAPTQASWKARMAEAADLTTLQYPLLFWHFLRDRPSKVKINLSIMGSFIVLHGILVFVWETAQIDPRPQRQTTSSNEQDLLDELSTHRTHVLRCALRKWRDCWDRSVSNPILSRVSNFHRDHLLVYWYLGCLLSEHDSPFTQYLSSLPSAKYWVITVPLVVKHIILLSRKGQLENVDTCEKAVAGLSHLAELLSVERKEDDPTSIEASANKDGGDGGSVTSIHSMERSQTMGIGEAGPNMAELAVQYMFSGPA